MQIGFPKKVPLYSCCSLPFPLLTQEGSRGSCIHSYTGALNQRSVSHRTPEA